MGTEGSSKVQDVIRNSIQGPGTLDEVLQAMKKWMRMKSPTGYGGINGLIIRGLKQRYIEMSGDRELDPDLPWKELCAYFDNKFGWTAEEEKRQAELRKRHRSVRADFRDLQIFIRIRLILGTLVQGMPPEGYKEELKKLGWYKTYREELKYHGWSEEQIDEFISELGSLH